jgi:hypothetical protein
MSDKHVFISHSHKDSAVAKSVVTALEQRGVNCWIAPRNVAPGGSYAESILTAIETASCFVLIYSEHSNVSSHVLREVERALKFGVNIVPVRFDDSTPSKSLDYLLATVHWLAIPEESRERSISTAAEQIAEWLKNFLTNPAAPLPQRIQRFQEALVTTLPPPRKRSRTLVGAALMLAAAAAALSVTGYLPLPTKPDATDVVAVKPKPGEVRMTPASNAIRPPSAGVKPKPGDSIGYAGRPSTPALRPTPNPAAGQLINGMPANQPPMYGSQPQPPPSGPAMSQQYGNGPGNGPGFGPPPDGRFGPPPPPPPPGRGRPMSGLTNGGPDQPPPNFGGPRP